MTPFTCFLLITLDVYFTLVKETDVRGPLGFFLNWIPFFETSLLFTLPKIVNAVLNIPCTTDLADKFVSLHP